jgi:Cu/Ag efflux pump CusA
VLVLDAARERFAPVVTTVAAVLVALLPVLVLGNSPGLEIVHPLAIAVLGGLLTSTFVVLVVVPAVYLVFGSRHTAHDAEAIVTD